MRVFASFLFLSLLAACAVPESQLPGASTFVTTSGEKVASGAVCRFGPDGGPVVVADRGIGGTGAPPAMARVADRGIGGTRSA